MEEDQILQSIIADPQLTDPSIDVGQLRQTTPTRTELLADVPEFSGLKFDPTQRSYIEDLYSIYGGGLPTIPEPVVEDTAQIPGAVDTLVDVGGGGGMNQMTGGLDTTPEQTFAGQPATSITPGTTIDNVTGNITNPDGSFGGNIVDEFLTPPSGITGDPIDVGIPDNESGFVDPLGTMGGTPVVSPVLTNQGPTIGTVDPTKAFADQTPLTDVELAEQGFLPNISNVTPPGFEPTVTINETPETFIDKTKNFLGLDNVDLPDFAIKAAINKAVGQPITLAFDLAKNIFSGQTTQNQGVTPDAGFADIVDDQGITADDAFDVTNEASVNVGTPSFEGFDSGGFDPAPAPASAPAPAPAPAPSYNPSRGGGRDSGGRNGGGSPGSAGPGGSDEMGSF